MSKENAQDNKETKVAKVDPVEAYKKVRLAIEHADRETHTGDEKYSVTADELKAMLQLDGKDGRPYMRDRKKLHTLYVWFYGEKEPLYIPREKTETVVVIDGVEYAPTAYFRRNGVAFQIQKNKSVMVPHFIKELFENSYDITTFKVPQIELDNGFKSRPVSPTQGAAPISISY